MAKGDGAGRDRRRERGSLFGIRQRTLMLFAVLTLLALLSVGLLALLGTSRIESTTSSNGDRLTKLAVDETGTALGELGRRKMEDRARLAAAKTQALVEGAFGDAELVARVAGPGLTGNVSGNFSNDLAGFLARAPVYSVIGWDGKATGDRRPVYDHLFLFDASGTLVAAGGNPDLTASIGSRFATSHWFAEASAALGLGARERYVYDPFAHNRSAGNSYWEPGKTAEDMIVLPHASLAPFVTVLPGNLAALKGKSSSEQHGTNPLLPDNGNWDPRQIGLFVFHPVRDVAGKLTGMAGVSMSIASTTQFFRKVQSEESADGRIGYAYAFNPQGVLVHHNQQQHIGSDSGWHPWVAWMQKNESGFIDYSFRNVRRYVAYEDIPQLGWKVAVTSPVSDFTRPAAAAGKRIDEQANSTKAQLASDATSLQQRTILLILVATAVAVVAGLAVAQHIVGPLKQLTSIANALGGGDKERSDEEAQKLEVKSALKGRKDEIGGLAVEVDRMVDAIREEGEKQRAQAEKMARDVQDQVSFVIERSRPAVNITIKDSVVNRSAIGGKMLAGKAAAVDQAFSACPFCGKSFDIPETPSYCPFCRKRLKAE